MVCLCMKQESGTDRFLRSKEKDYHFLQRLLISLEGRGGRRGQRRHVILRRIPFKFWFSIYLCRVNSFTNLKRQDSFGKSWGTISVKVPDLFTKNV